MSAAAIRDASLMYVEMRRITAAAICDVPLMSVEMRRHHGIGSRTLLTGNSRHVHVPRIRNAAAKEGCKGGARHTPDILLLYIRLYTILLLLYCFLRFIWSIFGGENPSIGWYLFHKSGQAQQNYILFVKMKKGLEGLNRSKQTQQTVVLYTSLEPPDSYRIHSYCVCVR